MSTNFSTFLSTGWRWVDRSASGGGQRLRRHPWSATILVWARDGALKRGEKVSLPVLIGMGLIIGGVALANARYGQQRLWGRQERR